MTAPVIHHARNEAAIIGAGPAGLACARWLLAQGLQPVLIEAAAGLGGQWNQGEGHSAIWPGMRTNTCRVLSQFSDLPHPEGTALFPRHDQMLSYLQRYASWAGIDRRLRTGTRVERLEREGEAWRLDLRGPDGTSSRETFARVVIATGRQASGALPDVEGSEGFSGSLGLRHASAYRGVEPYRGRDVVVGGCSISALEIASELALSGANRVTLASRRARYVLPKLLSGVPTDVALFTRGAALAGESVPVDQQRAGLKQLLMQAGAQPAAYGGRAADEDPFVAGISQAQHFLPLVAEGRIEVKPWIARVEGSQVHFTDGTSQHADGLLLGTGYSLHLPFLSPEIAATLALDADHIDLHEHTFHPELPGLAFVGLYDQTGPLLPVLELQARWVAYVLSGVVAAPTPPVMREGVEGYRKRRGGPQGVVMHAMALRFARLAGVEPEASRWPELATPLMAGPLSAVSFRLEGPDAMADAPSRVLADARQFGVT
jgi:dimethylaniline monooxygenase (N-oxide forming)